jgi:hypothetical protein
VGAGGYGEGWGGDFPINWKPFFFVAPDTNLKREFSFSSPLWVDGGLGGFGGGRWGEVGWGGVG